LIPFGQSGIFLRLRLYFVVRTGPARNWYFGTQFVFQVSKVASHSEHSKLAIWRSGTMASVRL
jgi:hypothetical protein